jgi:hypothetical protein
MSHSLRTGFADQGGCGVVTGLSSRPPGRVEKIEKNVYAPIREAEITHGRSADRAWLRRSHIGS